VARETATLDGSTLYRCLLVGLDDGVARDCSQAVRPLAPVRVADAREACARMSEVLPLIVIVPEAIASANAELAELAIACGAELVVLSGAVDGATLGKRLLDAVRKAEGRRVAR
jgi:hypothetical protein